MKVVFLTCLSLLFSAPIFAGDWIVESDSDCKIWSPDPIGQRETITFTSECVDGKAHGTGSLTVYDNGKKSRFYEGEFKSGKWQRGKGSLTTYNNGRKISHYKGELTNRTSRKDRNTGEDGNKYSENNLTSNSFQQAM